MGRRTREWERERKKEGDGSNSSVSARWNVENKVTTKFSVRGWIFSVTLQDNVRIKGYVGVVCVWVHKMYVEIQGKYASKLRQSFYRIPGIVLRHTEGNCVVHVSKIDHRYLLYFLQHYFTHR